MRSAAWGAGSSSPPTTATRRTWCRSGLGSDLACTPCMVHAFVVACCSQGPSLLAPAPAAFPATEEPGRAWYDHNHPLTHCRSPIVLLLS